MSSNVYLERIRPFGVVNDALSQAQWAEKKWVWITDKEQGFVAGFIIKEEASNENVLVQLLNDTVLLLSELMYY